MIMTKTIQHGGRWIAMVARSDAPGDLEIWRATGEREHPIVPYDYGESLAIEALLDAGELKDPIVEFAKRAAKQIPGWADDDVRTCLIVATTPCA